MNPENIDRVVRAALKEDIGSGDITTLLLVPAGLRVEAVIVARQRAVVCGLEIVQRIFCLLDKSVRVSCVVGDGVRVKPGQVLLRISGRARGILTGERVALNFLGRLSGIATVTRSFTDAVRG